MQDAAPRRHPLHVARAELTAVAKAVAMLDGAGQHVRNRLDAAVGMPRKAGEIVVRVVVSEVVQEQKRIVVGRLAEAERAAQPDTGALDRRLRLHDAPDGTDGHDDRISHPLASGSCGPAGSC